MSTKHLNAYLRFWEDVFNANNPAKQFLKSEGHLPTSLLNKVDLDVYPEPYWGDLKKMTTDDVLLLYINPGKIDRQTQDVSQLNRNILARYREPWTKEQYLEYHSKTFAKGSTDYPGWKWMGNKVEQLNRIFEDDFQITYSIELFPLHSKNWLANRGEREGVCVMQSTRLALAAVKEIAAQRKVRAILAISKNWVDVFDTLKTEYAQAAKPVILQSPNGGIAHRIYAYRSDVNSLPVVVYSGPSMNLPRDEKAVKAIRRMSSL
jgi:hypothetical protein